MTPDTLLFTSLALPVALAVAYAVKPKPLTQQSDQRSGQDPLDPALLELMRPGPEHAQLGKLAGTWDVDCTMWMMEGQDPVESTGRAVFTPVFDGRFVQCEFTGSFMGQPFHGRSTLGYDRAAKRYFSTWHDNMATGFVYLSGTSSDGGKTITYTGESVCPRMGPMSVRQEERHEADDRFTLVMYQKAKSGGQERKSMELVYTRRA